MNTIGRCAFPGSNFYCPELQQFYFRYGAQKTRQNCEYIKRSILNLNPFEFHRLTKMTKMRRTPRTRGVKQQKYLYTTLYFKGEEKLATVAYKEGTSIGSYTNANVGKLSYEGQVLQFHCKYYDNFCTLIVSLIGSVRVLFCSLIKVINNYIYFLTANCVSLPFQFFEFCPSLFIIFIDNVNPLYGIGIFGTPFP